MISLRDKIISNIHKQKLIPRPRWQYVLGHFILWSVCILTLLAGAVAFSLMLMEFDMPERVFIRWMDMQDNATLLLALPYLWLLWVFLALLLGYFLFSRTERWYRIRAFFVVLSLLVWSLLFWWILFSTHVVHWGEERFRQFEPHYRNFRRGVRMMMPRPEDGVLPLRVLRVDNDIFFGNDPAGHSWAVHLVCHTPECDSRKKQINKPFLFHGVVKDPGKFEADNILRPEKWRFLPVQQNK